MSKATHPRPGTSSRRRSRVPEVVNNDVPTKRMKTSFSIQSSASDSDYHEHAPPQQSLPCRVGFSDQCVPSQGSDELLSMSSDELNFFDEPCLSKMKYVKVDTNKDHPLGYFAALPTELFHLVLKFLDNVDLGSLANVSAEMCIVVCGYVYTPVGVCNVLPKYSEGDFAEPMEFTELGV